MTILPKVGDQLMRLMTVRRNCCITEPEPESCIVTYVNAKHGYYIVKFDRTGISESYKLHGMDDMYKIAEFIENYKRAFGVYPKGIYVYESGAFYKTIKDCLKDIGVSYGLLSKHLRGDTSTVNGYHVYLL